MLFILLIIIFPFFFVLLLFFSRISGRGWFIGGRGGQVCGQHLEGEEEMPSFSHAFLYFHGGFAEVPEVERWKEP
jgi:hypothetical protein